jgi:hypothetical protein
VHHDRSAVSISSFANGALGEAKVADETVIAG